MKIRIDLKILIFLALFYFTNQLKIYLIIMFFCFIHELGHIIVGLLLKMGVEKLEIMPCGLSASFFANSTDTEHKIRKGDILELKKIIIACAGPLVSLILVVIFTYMNSYQIDVIKQEAIYSNIIILIFNLLPIYPLDGGRIIKGILHIELGESQAQEIVSKISKIAMISLTMISSIAVYYFKNIAIFLVCVFLWIISLRYY